MKNIVDCKAPDRNKIRAYFSAMGSTLSESLLNVEESFVMTASGCPGGGKSMMTDEVMEGALSASKKRIYDRSYWEGDSRDLNHYTFYDPDNDDEDFEPEIEPDAYIDYGERHYDLWQGRSAESGKPLQSFFFNAAILPTEHEGDVVRRVLGFKDHEPNIPSNMRTFYHRPDPRAFMKQAGQLILITNETEYADVKPDLHADLSHVYPTFDLTGRENFSDGFSDPFVEEKLNTPTHQHLKINYDENSPYAKQIEAAHDAHKHHLGLG